MGFANCSNKCDGVACNSRKQYDSLKASPEDISCSLKSIDIYTANLLDNRGSGTKDSLIKEILGECSSFTLSKDLQFLFEILDLEEGGFQFFFQLGDRRADSGGKSLKSFRIMPR